MGTLAKFQRDRHCAWRHFWVQSCAWVTFGSFDRCVPATRICLREQADLLGKSGPSRHHNLGHIYETDISVAKLRGVEEACLARNSEAKGSLALPAPVGLCHPGHELTPQGEASKPLEHARPSG